MNKNITNIFDFASIESEAAALKKSFNEDGFAVVQNIFDDQFSDQLRHDCSSIAKSVVTEEDKPFYLANAFSEHASVASVLLNENIHLLISILIDNARWGFWGHSDVSLNAEAPWHKDDGGNKKEENYFGIDAIASDSAVIIKFAIYLQDHTHDGGSLSVIPKSHRQYFPGTSKPVDVRATSHDLVIFDARITHRGRQNVIVPYLRFSRNLFILANKINAKFTRSYRKIKKKMGLQPSKIRYALFFSVAEYCSITDTFGRNMVAHAERKGYPVGGVHPTVKKELLKKDIFIYPE